jgi:hypothetical protein
MKSLMIEGLPSPPQKPEDYECCKRHCDPCIMDYYYEAMDRWRDRIAAKGLDPDAVLAQFAKEQP